MGPGKKNTRDRNPNKGVQMSWLEELEQLRKEQRRPSAPMEQPSLRIPAPGSWEPYPEDQRPKSAETDDVPEHGVCIIDM